MSKYDHFIKAGVCNKCITIMLDITSASDIDEKMEKLHLHLNDLDRDCMRALLRLTNEPVKLNDPSSLADLKRVFNPDLNPGMQSFNTLLAHAIH